MNVIEGMIDCLCLRAQPEGINNVHALNYIREPRSYIIIMIHHPLYAIISCILPVHAVNLPKIHKKATISTASSHVSCSTKFTVKLMTWLVCTI